MENLQENNKVTVIGEIFTDFALSHSVYGESFYTFKIKVPRLSDISDFLLVTVSERLLQDQNFQMGDLVYITGQYRSYNNNSEIGNKLILTIFAKDMQHADENQMNVNSIFLNGYVCKKPVYRTTPFGREIADILIAVNRSYNKSDYIPCIAWGRNARFSNNFEVGDNINVYGRIQSREYQKKISDDESVTKTAYEISITKIEQL